MESITLVPMTKELAHRVFNGYQSDPADQPDGAEVLPFVYSSEWVESYFQKQERLGNILFAIMHEDTPIGELKLYNVSKRQKKCLVSVHIKHDRHKNMGFGKKALRKAMDYVKETLKMNTMEARVLLKNGRAMHVLKRLGFTESHRDSDTAYFEKDLDRVEDVKIISMIPMTKELYHEFHKGFEYDLPPKGQRANFRQYVYDEESLNLVYSLQTMMIGRLKFAVMIDGAPVGEADIHSIDETEGSCVLECCMQKKEYKNRGYGKAAIVKLLRYAKQTLGLKIACAVVSVENTHAQHVLERIGFVEIGRTKQYYREDDIHYEILLRDV